MVYNTIADHSFLFIELGNLWYTEVPKGNFKEATLIKIISTNIK